MIYVMLLCSVRGHLAWASKGNGIDACSLRGLDRILLYIHNNESFWGKVIQN